MKYVILLISIVLISGCSNDKTNWANCKYKNGDVIQTVAGGLDGQVINAFRHPNKCIYDTRVMNSSSEDTRFIMNEFEIKLKGEL